MSSFGGYDGDDFKIKGDDGSIDGKKIGVVGDRLKVDTVINQPGSNIAICWDNKYRILSDKPDTTIPGSGSAPYVIESYSGTGKLIGFSAAWDSDRTLITLVIDGVEVFELDTKVMKDYTRDLDFLLANSFQYHETEKLFSFTPDNPICFDTSYSIETRSNDGNTGRKIKAWWSTSVRVS
jgi:hypothetical protein